MTPQDLISHIKDIAGAPGGIAQLRALVLQLAVRGQLVPQDSMDEPAGELLKRVIKRRNDLVEELIKAKRIRRRKMKKTPEFVEPFSIPDSWTWCKWGEFSEWITYGFTRPMPHVAQGIPIITGKNVVNGKIDLSRCHYTTKEAFEHLSEKDKPRIGDLLITKDGSIGRAAVVNGTGKFCINQSVAVVWLRSCEFSRDYLLLAIQSPLLQKPIHEHAKGAAVKHLSITDFATFPFPLPPLAEQRRIVARVDALMALLDRLEAAQTTRQATRSALRDAALAALRDAPDADAVQAAWGRIVANADALFTAPEDVAPLRQAILQLAVRGRLVRQDPADEPAEKLLERIAAEKARLVKERKIRKTKMPPPEINNEIPFNVPPGWAWCRLGNVLKQCRNGVSVRPNRNGIGFKLLRISAGTSRKDAIVDLSDYRYGDVPKEKAKKYFIEPGDLLACRFNGNLHFVGKVAQVPEALSEKILHPDKLICLRAIYAQHSFLRVAINSESCRKQIRNVAATTAGNIGINGKQIQSLFVPLPPLGEQRRIVAKVDALLALCDQLEARLTAARDAHTAFAAAAIHHLDT